jgi:iron(II)-dependent oxidoreductase
LSSIALAAQPAPEMLRIPAGSFIMGSDDGPADERPAHRVTLPAFLIDRLPVTNYDFAQFLNARGARAPDGRRYYDDDDNDARIHRQPGPGPLQLQWQADAGHARHPVVEASWLGALAYCRWRGKRLPSEAEWERAARGDDGRRYPWGNAAPEPRLAWFGKGWNELTEVDAHPAGASPYGVLDMAGNGWEWVSSLYRPYPWRADDGREDLSAAGVRGTRGGGHDARPADMTTSQRGRLVSRAPEAGHHNITFRCAVEAGAQ